MAKKSFKQDERKPLDYFSAVQAAQKQEKSNASNLGASLRADLIPSSNAEPARQSPIQRDQIKTALGILLGIIIVVFFLFIVVGPGRPILEQNLASLALRTTTPTLELTSTPVPPTLTPDPPTPTLSPSPSPSPTYQPTRTPVVAMLATSTPTAKPPTATPTIPGCRDVLSITLDDVGKEICVQGKILETINHTTDFMVIFSYARGSFVLVSYDLVWTKGKVGACYRITGTIDKINYTPVMVFNLKNMPEACP